MINNITSSKKKYITNWNNHIATLNLLYSNNEAYNQELKNLTDKLKELVLKISEVKKLK
jgi:hypothetical protein